ncbi:hypothetical protein U9M48_018900 [Paspalum notatum var. saurae]|uniref:Uncharacterized protein n=1 Tax=Paspalum notatum var. saurae TaxID=547442 RepID=A0AAQ3TCJ1_PASNO
MQRFGADGFVGKEQRMEAKLGTKPSFVDVWIEGHKGPDPKNPEVLCDEQATEKLALSQKLGGAVPEFRTPQPSPQEAPTYFSGPINQGPPLGDAQGWIGSNAPEFRPPQLSPQVPPNYFVTTPTSQGSPLGDAQGSQPYNQIIPSGQSQQPPQWVYPGQPMMMYRGSQPMFYPASQPPYYMPWRSTAPPMTPPGSTSRAPSQNPDEVDAFLNQSGGAGEQTLG